MGAASGHVPERVPLGATGVTGTEDLRDHSACASVQTSVCQPPPSFLRASQGQTRVAEKAQAPRGSPRERTGRGCGKPSGWAQGPGRPRGEGWPPTGPATCTENLPSTRRQALALGQPETLAAPELRAPDGLVTVDSVAENTPPNLLFCQKTNTLNTWAFRINP